MRKYQYLLFDLDGTLTDSREGIVNCVKYALNLMQAPIPDENILSLFIGPPLPDSFRQYCGFTREQSQQAVRLFRERYNRVGKFENAAAPGMPELCAKLKLSGFILALASSKLEHMCLDICDYFNFTPSFKIITGSPPEENCDKAQVIQEAMRRLNLHEADKIHTLMIGDRKYDIEGARICGLDCVGADFFHYAPPGELEQANPAAIVRDAAELENFLLNA